MAALSPLTLVISQASTAQAAGSTWSIVTSPNVGSNDRLNGVSCVSSAFCIGVGFYTNESNMAYTLIESWGGTRWAVTPSPNKGDGGELRAVSCVLPTSCEAVGDFGNVSGKVGTLVEDWNGRSWSIAPSPNPNGKYSAFFGVSCVSSTDCVAVGDDGRLKTKTLVESWNGRLGRLSPARTRETAALSSVCLAQRPRTALRSVTTRPRRVGIRPSPSYGTGRSGLSPQAPIGPATT
jgi:hypothetical protein